MTDTFSLLIDACDGSQASVARLRRLEHLQEDFDDISTEPRRLMKLLEGLHHTLTEGYNANLAWAADLANHLHDMLHDADGFNAVRMGDDGDVVGAIELLSKAVK